MEQASASGVRAATKVVELVQQMGSYVPYQHKLPP
jgi:hypothetical protein